MSWNPFALSGQKGTKRQRKPPLTHEKINSLFELIQKNTTISLQQVLNAVAFWEIDFSYFSSEGNSLLLSVIKKIGENYNGDDLYEKLNMCISLADNLIEEDEQGISLGKPNALGVTPLLAICFLGGNTLSNLTLKLISRGKVCNPSYQEPSSQEGDSGFTALMYCVENFSTNVAIKLIELLRSMGTQGLQSISRVNTDGDTALIIASRNEHVAPIVVVHLIDSMNSNPTHVDSTGFTALMYCIENHRDALDALIDELRKLKETGLESIKVVNEEGDTALTIACRTSHIPYYIVEMLIETNHSNPSHVNTKYVSESIPFLKGGATALMLAILSDRLSDAIYLVEFSIRTRDYAIIEYINKNPVSYHEGGEYYFGFTAFDILLFIMKIDNAFQHVEVYQKITILLMHLIGHLYKRKNENPENADLSTLFHRYFSIICTKIGVENLKRIFSETDIKSVKGIDVDKECSEVHSLVTATAQFAAGPSGSSDVGGFMRPTRVTTELGNRASRSPSADPAPVLAGYGTTIARPVRGAAASQLLTAFPVTEDITAAVNIPRTYRIGNTVYSDSDFLQNESLYSRVGQKTPGQDLYDSGRAGGFAADDQIPGRSRSRSTSRSASTGPIFRFFSRLSGAASTLMSGAIGVRATATAFDPLQGAVAGGGSVSLPGRPTVGYYGPGGIFEPPFVPSVPGPVPSVPGPVPGPVPSVPSPSVPSPSARSPSPSLDRTGGKRKSRKKRKFTRMSKSKSKSKRKSFTKRKNTKK
jgi:ankyrin repeat protein